MVWPRWLWPSRFVTELVWLRWFVAEIDVSLSYSNVMNKSLCMPQSTEVQTVHKRIERKLHICM